MTWIFRTESAAYLAQAPNRDNWQEILRGLCRYFRENRAFYCNAMSYNGQNSLREYLFDTFSGVVQQHCWTATPALWNRRTRLCRRVFRATIRPAGALVRPGHAGGCGPLRGLPDPHFYPARC